MQAPPGACAVHGAGIEVGEAKWRASAFEVEDFPTPAGPSMATRITARPPSAGNGPRLGQHTIGAGLEVTKLDRPDLGAHQTANRVSDGAEDAADDTVLAGVEHHLDDGLVAVGIDDGAMVQLDQAVIQLDALGHQAPADVAADLAINRGDVGLLHSYFGCMTCWLSSPSLVMRIRPSES